MDMTFGLKQLVKDWCKAQKEPGTAPSPAKEITIRVVYSPVWLLCEPGDLSAIQPEPQNF